jgi:capsular exopolysaccharide synthesis family protein
MGRLFEALQRSSAQIENRGSVGSEPGIGPEILETVDSEVIDLDRVSPLTVSPTPERRLVVLSGRSVGAEKIRILAARLRQLQDQRPVKKLLITSTVKDEGKTVLSANLAMSLAKTKQRVLLIDGDCHQANAGRLLGANGSPGLTDWWRAERAIQGYLMRVNRLPLWFLPAGEPVEQPLEMLQSGRLSDLVNTMSGWFDWVIIDSPPSAPLADAAVWGDMADAILLIARKGRTPKRLLRKVLEAVDDKKLLGVVLNDCSDPDQRHYLHYYNAPSTN